jgi:alkylresorcinol/alkylpyrone synthase
MIVAAVGHAFPPHYYDQDQLLEAFRTLWLSKHYNPERLERLHKNVRVSGRHLALPLEEYQRLESWGQANDAWIRVAQEVGASALDAALGKLGLEYSEIDALFTVTVTGVATPSLDARLMNRRPFRPDTKRIPIFGLGCVAGAAGIARAADYVRAFPDQIAVLLSVELCSLTVQRGDLSIPNLIATGLFGDGAAAAVLLGEEAAARRGLGGRGGGYQVAGTRSVFYPGTEGVMGWDISGHGFQIVLSAEVPQMVESHLRGDVDAFLADHGTSRAEIARFICHPGGPKVLEAMEEQLETPPGALDATWRSLEEVGNLSSTSVLLVMEETLEELRKEPPPQGEKALLLAMGPGFCSELVLLEAR